MRANMIPTDRHYTPGHSWLALPPGARFADYPIRAGVTDIPIAPGGDVVAVELPGVRDDVRAGTECAVLRMSSGAVVTVRSPISGLVTITNQDVKANPQLAMDDPFYKGWLFAILPTSASAMDGLLTPAQYARILTKGDDG